MHLEQELALWDGKTAADIESIYNTHKAELNFSDTIVALSLVDTCEKGATWLLKAWFEAGNQLKKPQITEIYRSLDQLESWEAKLHILQCMPYMPITDAEKINVYRFLRSTLTHQNKFVRAWSYNAFYVLSRQHAEYVNETKKYFEMAMRDEAPSVKARIRNCMKQGF